jgi:hypothetical protein
MASESPPPRYKGKRTTICPHLEAGGYRSQCRVAGSASAISEIVVVLAGSLRRIEGAITEIVMVLGENHSGVGDHVAVEDNGSVGDHGGVVDHG